MRLKNTPWRWGIILFMLWSLSGCQKTDDSQPVIHLSGNGPAYGDIFIDGSIGDASTLIPPLASDSASRDIASLVYNGL
ncbi:MAG: peptide-binding protein, partial [Deltaproteobacteria bacterium]|nr:peptide-binding protein [Deltaproteobacteria bacterium]